MEEASIIPSDAKSWSLCVRRIWYDKFPPKNTEIKIEPFDQLIIEKGLEHEKNILAKLSQNRSVKTAESTEHTQLLMDEGIDVIYQAQFYDEDSGLVGNPDFLIKHESGKYQPADAKLARSAEDKKEIKVQLGIYRRLLGTDLPGLVYLGNGKTEEIDDNAYPIVDKFLTEMGNILGRNKPPVVRYSHSKCKICPYFSICQPEFIQKDELTLIHGIDSRSAPHLEDKGIKNIQRLSECDTVSIPDVPYLKNFEKKQRAVLQAKSWLTGEVFKLNDIDLPEGTWIHFDIEDNPLEPSGQKHVYLWGLLKPDYDNSSFEFSWTDSMAEDHQGWEGFLGLIEKYKFYYSDLIIAHYSNHEITTIKQYVERYDMHDHPIVEWLLGEETPLYDMQKPVIQNLVLPLLGYGLKDICKHENLVNFQWENEDSGSQWSIVQFNRFQQEKEVEMRKELKEAILSYNRDDVLATRKLEEWLRKL